MAEKLAFCKVRETSYITSDSVLKNRTTVRVHLVCVIPLSFCRGNITNDIMVMTGLVLADKVTLSAAKNGGEKETVAQIELSQEAQERIQKNIEARRRSSKYIKVLDGETRTFKFFPEETDSYKSEKFGDLRFAYIVIEKGNYEKQIWEVSRTTSERIDDLFMEVNTILTIHRIGSDKRTVYDISPASKSEIEELELRLRELEVLEEHEE